jgi:ankyrin repeat protein
VHLLPEIIAEYCNDMTMLQDLIDNYATVLDVDHRNGFTPLHWACFYQNQDTIRTLLEEYRRREGRKLLLDRLLIFNNECMSPLGYLVLKI